MGGKDATIVDDEADVDAAVEGVAQAAFGYQGQKCSACSRAIVHEKVYDEFVEKLQRAREEGDRRAERGSGQLHGAGGERDGAEDDAGLYRCGQEGRARC